MIIKNTFIFMNKNLIIAALAILILVFGWLAFQPRIQKIPVKEISLNTSFVMKPYPASKLSALGDITCTYPQVLQASYSSGEIKHELPKPETNPIVMTFGDIQEKTSKIKFIDATRTISEVPIMKFVDNEEKLIFIEGNGNPYITTHTIYKNTGISIYAKQLSFLGTPVGTISMGTCVDY